MCKKKQYYSVTEALEAMKYLVDNNIIENRRYTVYNCSECYMWHFGTPTSMESYGTAGLKRT